MQRLRFGFRKWEERQLAIERMGGAHRKQAGEGRLDAKAGEERISGR
jgi:hypothetical protein